MSISPRLRTSGALYWAISPSVVRSVLGEIRAVFTQLLAGLCAAVGVDGQLPSAAEATFQVEVVMRHHARRPFHSSLSRSRAAAA